MAKLSILTAPDPRLKRKSLPVTSVDDAIRQLIDDMFETMYAAPGVGLAAPQVGDLRRIVVIDVARQNETPTPLALINPEIIAVTEDDAAFEEGCLSVPEQYADVVRPRGVTVRFLDRNGVRQDLSAEGLLAVCVQHEIDHLDGILFIDHLSQLKRNMILRKLTKARRQGDSGE